MAINKNVTPTVMPAIFPVELDPSDSLLTGVSILTGVDVTITGPGASTFKLYNYKACNQIYSYY